jgi:hypothetical protein
MQLRYEGAALPTSRQREGAYAVIYIIGLIGLDTLSQLPTHSYPQCTASFLETN